MSLSLQQQSLPLQRKSSRGGPRPAGVGGTGNDAQQADLLAGDTEGPFSEEVNAGLSDLFGASLAGITAGIDGQATDALDADAVTEGSSILFGTSAASLFSGGTPDDDTFALAAHEVAHALGASSGARALDGPADAGEAQAKLAESAALSMRRGGSAQAAPASGGGARLQRRSTSGGSFTGRPALRYGQRGTTVKALQAQLNAHGARLPTTGYFGRMTLAALRDFQRRNGLTVDGIAGPATAQALAGGTASAAGWSGKPVLTQGDRGAMVSSLQTQLNARGSTLPVTGYFGEQTAAALRAFQRANGLTVDAEAGPTTYRALSQALDDAKADDDHKTTCTLSGSPALKRGSRGPQVRELQTALTKAGFSTGTDGIFGRGTERQVRAFQQANGLQGDGVVGPQTARKLNDCVNGVAPKPDTQGPATDGPTTAPGDSDHSAGEVRDADPKSTLTSPNLHPEVRKMAGETVRKLQAEGLRPYVFEGYRSFARQNALYNSGRGVTGVRGGGSYHNYGLAVDIVFWNSSNTGPSWDNGHAWDRVGVHGKAAGFTEWGGDWGWDRPHLEYHPGHDGSAYALQPAYNRGGLSEVWASLGTDLSTIQSATTWDGVLTGEIELRKGTSGEAVRTLQAKLNTHGAGISTDGQFGSGTEGALKAFQRAQGLPETGVVDQATAQKLG